MTRQPTGAASSPAASGFERLLKRLDPDADRAAAEYERLRLTLAKFFDWRGVTRSDECADQTIDRLALKLQQDAPIEDVRRYAHGIARLVLLEELRHQAHIPIDSHPDLTQLPVVSPAEPSEPLHTCFERCLAALPDESRTLVLRYYATGDGAGRRRRRLARSMGLSDIALRSRVHRIKHALERCVQAALRNEPGATGTKR